MPAINPWSKLLACHAGILAGMIALVSTPAPAQTTADGVAAFHHGRYAEARRILENAPPSDATARTFLALARAATGACDAARPDLVQQFAKNPDAAERRLAGIAAVQCDLALNRTSDAIPILAA